MYSPLIGLKVIWYTGDGTLADEHTGTVMSVDCAPRQVIGGTHNNYRFLILERDEDGVGRLIELWSHEIDCVEK